MEGTILEITFLFLIMSKKLKYFRSYDNSNENKLNEYNSHSAFRITIHLIQYGISFTYFRPDEENIVTCFMLQQRALRHFNEISDTNVHDIIFSKNYVDIVGNPLMDTASLGISPLDHLQVRNTPEIDVNVKNMVTKRYHLVKIHPNKTIRDLKLVISVRVEKYICNLLLSSDGVLMPNDSIIAMWNVSNGSKFELHYNN